MYAHKCLSNIPYIQTRQACWVDQVWCCCFTLVKLSVQQWVTFTWQKSWLWSWLYSNEGVTNMKQHIRDRSQSIHKYMYKLSITLLFRRTIFSMSLKYDTIPAKWPNNYSNPINTKTCSLTRYDCVIPRIISQTFQLNYLQCLYLPRFWITWIIYKI